MSFETRVIDDWDGTELHGEPDGNGWELRSRSRRSGETYHFLSLTNLLSALYYDATTFGLRETDSLAQRAGLIDD